MPVGARLESRIARCLRIPLRHVRVRRDFPTRVHARTLPKTSQPTCISLRLRIASCRYQTQGVQHLRTGLGGSLGVFLSEREIPSVCVCSLEIAVRSSSHALGLAMLDAPDEG